MMDLPIPVRDDITDMKRQDNAYIFTTERGLLKISFNADNLAHIRFTVSGKFGDKQDWILPNITDVPSHLSEDKEYYYISLNSCKIAVSKANSSVSFYRDNALIFAEDSSMHRQFEAVREYITVDDENIATKDVVTADGIKKVIDQAHRIEGRKLYKSRLHLSFDETEALYGLGQSEEGVLNLRGHVKYLHQGNRKIAIPVLMSQKGYGLFFPSGSAGMFCDNESGTYFQIEADESMEYYFLGGSKIDESISMFRYLTGKAELLPLWAYGYLQSKERYESEAEVLEIAREFRDRKIGLDGIILDWLTWDDNMWGQKTLDKKRFPDPAGMMEKLHDRDLHLLISIWPNMTAACDNYKEFKEQGLIYPGTEIYDALSEKARKLYWKQAYEGLYQYGIDGFWCDSSEPFTPEWTKEIKPDAASAYMDFYRTATASLPYDRINAYGFYHAQAIYEGQRSVDEHRVINLTRNGYPGSQRFGTILWSGDIGASFDTLRRQVAEGLNLCVSGLPYWTLDIGAFFVKPGKNWFWDGHYAEGLDNMGYRELYVRWYQLGAFLPIFRSHGTDCPREPWRFGEPGDMFYDAIIKANELRYSLMPYISTLAYKVWSEDYTIMRMLPFDFPEDERCKNISDQYLFGPELMVCPVLTEMYYNEKSEPIKRPHKRKVYFPKGCNWVDIRDKKVYEGGTTANVNADIYTIPVFAKAGSTIPMCKAGESVADTLTHPITNVTFGDTAESRAPFEYFPTPFDGYDYMTT